MRSTISSVTFCTLAAMSQWHCCVSFDSGWRAAGRRTASSNLPLVIVRP